MNFVQKILSRLDDFQRKHPVIGFPFAVVKKYGDDRGGYQAALITYYGFLSLFPLLLVLMTVLQLLFNNNDAFRQEVTDNISGFFPLLGDQLQSNISSMGKTGIGLVVGLLITMYGVRGAADAMRFVLDNMWQVPMSKRPGFPKGIIRSFMLVGLGALGFLVTVAVSSLTSGLGHGWEIKLVLNVIGVTIGAVTLAFIFRTATAKQVALKDLWPGAIIAAFIIQMLLTFGSLIVATQLKNLDSLYGTFAIVLGLVFWIYLIAQVVVYAAEINTVRSLKLWPRALMMENPTTADRTAYDLYAKTEKRIPPERVRTHFKKK